MPHPCQFLGDGAGQEGRQLPYTPLLGGLRVRVSWTLTSQPDSRLTLKAQDPRTDPPLPQPRERTLSLLDPTLAPQASVAPRIARDPLDLGRPERDSLDLLGRSLAFWEDGGITHSS